jgi:hypothetical protein
MKFNFIEKPNSSVLLIGDKEQVTISNLNYAPYIRDIIENRFFDLRVVSTNYRLVNIDLDNDDVFIEGAPFNGTATELYDLVEGYFFMSSGLIDFISLWETTTANETIQLPVTNLYTVDWGDGTVTTTETSHEYLLSGQYEVKIKGEITDFTFNGTGDRLKILQVSNFGGFNLINSCFNGCENLTYIDDDFKVLGTSLGNTFKECFVLDSPMDSLNTTGITVMTSTFRDASIFNQDLNHFDTSSIYSISGCFYQAYAFNGDVSNWDVSNIESISLSFFRASSFNGDLSNWITTSLTDCSAAFQDATSFNSDIGGWDVSNVLFMNNMLRNTIFNHPLNLWDTSKVETMDTMFFQTTSFNQDISSWDFSSVKSINNFMLLKTAADYNATYYDNLLIKWDNAVGGLVFANMTNVNIGMGTIKYTSFGSTARANLISKGFIITDGGQV